MKLRTEPRARAASKAPTESPTRIDARTSGGIGESVGRPDGERKVRGEFDYSSDLWAEGMLWGVTLRSPHPSARILSIDPAEAERYAGVHAVLTHEDIPGRKTFGMEIPDQPVLAWERIRYQGEPVALVAADHPEAARRAAAKIAVEYEVNEPVTDAEAAIAGTAPELHPSGNLLRHLRINQGEFDTAHAEVVVTGEYEMGMQDQAFLGPESGLAVPDGRGGVDLHIATQWMHVDRDQVAASLGLEPEEVRLHLSGVGGAFGGREDVSMQVHSCLLALHTGRPVKISYGREESFFGHVHRHPAKMQYEHGATREGELVYVKARLVLDGGAYASSSPAVVSNAACFACGPYEVPNARIDAYMAYTNNPPCGAMRGFGAVQVCFAYESQMDKLATALDMDPVELRRKNAFTTGSRLPTGQPAEGPVPVAELLRRVKALPLPEELDTGTYDLRELPGGVSNATHGEGVVRGVGYAVGFKNLGYSEGFDDYSTARVRLCLRNGEPVAEVYTAAAEVGQGLVTVMAQIARTELQVENAVVMPADTLIGSAGSTSASRQTYMTGGAVKRACETVRERLFDRARDRESVPTDASADLSLGGGAVLCEGRPVADLADLLAAGEIDETLEFHHRPTDELDEDGQGRAHVTFAYAAHRAVVEVDTELGLVRVVELATAQDVGRALNPLSVEGQIEGGAAQGMGLALMEEIQVTGGKIDNASFTDYLIPTILDMPPVRAEILELADTGNEEAPYGLKGVGEPPTISSTPAVVAALRAATGYELPRVPVKPEQLAGLEGSG